MLHGDIQPVLHPHQPHLFQSALEHIPVDLPHIRPLAHRLVDQAAGLLPLARQEQIEVPFCQGTHGRQRLLLFPEVAAGELHIPGRQIHVGPAHQIIQRHVEVIREPAQVLFIGETSALFIIGDRGLRHPQRISKILLAQTRGSAELFQPAGEIDHSRKITQFEY